MNLPSIPWSFVAVAALAFELIVLASAIVIKDDLLECRDNARNRADQAYYKTGNFPGVKGQP